MGGLAASELAGREHRLVLVEVHARQLLDAAPAAGRAVEPQLVLLDRSADAEPDVVDLLDLARARQTSRAQVIVQVVALEAVVRALDVEAPVELVAAVLGHHVRVQPAALGLGSSRAGLHDDFLDHHLVELVSRRQRDVVGRAQLHPVERADAVLRPVNLREPEHGLALAAAGFAAAERARGERTERHGGQRLDALGCGQRVEHLSGQHALLPGVRDVDDRARARDGDRLLDAADTHVGVRPWP